MREDFYETTLKTYESEIRELMVSTWQLKMKPEEIPDADNLLEALNVNSVDVLELLVQIEQKFDIEIDDEDLNAKLINSLPALATYIEYRKRQPA